MRKKDKERDLRKLYFSTGKYPKKNKKYLDEEELEYLKRTRKFWFKIKTLYETYPSKIYTKKDMNEISKDGLGGFHLESRHNWRTGEQENMYVRKLKGISFTPFDYYSTYDYYIFSNTEDGMYSMTFNEIQDAFNISSQRLYRRLCKMSIKDESVNLPKGCDTERVWTERTSLKRNRTKLHQDLKRLSLGDLEENNNLSSRKDLYEKICYDLYW